MFMQFQGGGVGHLGTHSLDLKLREDNHLDPHEEWGDGQEKDSGTYEKRTNHIEPRNEDDDEVDDEDKSTDNEQEIMDNKQDLDNEDEEAMNDDEVLEEKGFAELWDSVAEQYLPVPLE